MAELQLTYIDILILLSIGLCPYISKEREPWLLVEHQPMHQRLLIQFLVSAYAQVVGLIPSRGCARSSGSMFLSHINILSLCRFNKNIFFKERKRIAYTETMIFSSHFLYFNFTDLSPRNNK